MELTKRQAARLELITGELASLGPCLPGSVVVRTGRCGTFRSWTRKITGKTVTRLLSEDQLDDYQVLFDNHRRLKELVHELEDLGLAIVDADPRWSA